jgi:hypothetical protein
LILRRGLARGSSGALAGTPITDAAAAACKIGPDERVVLAHREHANGVQVLRSTAQQNGSELEKRMKNGTEGQCCSSKSEKPKFEGPLVLAR